MKYEVLVGYEVEVEAESEQDAYDKVSFLCILGWTAGFKRLQAMIVRSILGNIIIKGHVHGESV